MSLSKYMLLGAGVAVAGATLLYFAKDTDSMKFDSKVHTVQKLMDILEELYLDYAGSYLFYYDILLNQKEQGTFKPDMIDQIRVRVEELTRQNDITLCQRHNISTDFLQEWIQKYHKDARVAAVLKNISDISH